MTMTREELITLALIVYAEARNDKHWRSLIAHRPIEHLREKGYKITRIDFFLYKVE